MLRKILDLIRCAIHRGTCGFSDAERELLSYVLDSLSENDKKILSAQISAVSLVQRQHPGRLVVAYYRNPTEVQKLPYSGHEHHLANVTYRSKGQTKTAAVVLHEGRLMSLEHNVPTAAGDIDSLVRIQLHPKGYAGVAKEIDAEEHAESA